MMKTQLVIKLKQNGYIKESIRKELAAEPEEENCIKVSRMFIRLRYKYDFLF